VAHKTSQDEVKLLSEHIPISRCYHDLEMANRMLRKLEGSQSVSLGVSKVEAGSYSVVVDGLSGSFVVVAPPPVPPRSQTANQLACDWLRMNNSSVTGKGLTKVAQ